MNGSRKRGVSNEERLLFNETLKDVAPLRKKAAPKVPRHALSDAPKSKPMGCSPKLEIAAPLIGIKAHPPRHEITPPAIGGHRAAHLRRGRIEPEARLDLHGFTQDEAYRALQRFLMRARGHDFRVVLVITGKGGVLRDAVPRWLAQTEFRGFISGAAEAHIRHGGGGALYVSLRRARGG